MSNFWKSQFNILSSDVKLWWVFLSKLCSIVLIFSCTLKSPGEGCPTFGVLQIESDISFVCFVGLHMKYLFVVQYFLSLYRLIQI